MVQDVGMLFSPGIMSREVNITFYQPIRKDIIWSHIITHFICILIIALQICKIRRLVKMSFYSKSVTGSIFVVVAHWSKTLSSIPANLFLLFLIIMLCVKQRSSKYQWCSLWFDPIGARTHELPHPNGACLLLHDRKLYAFCI